MSGDGKRGVAAWPKLPRPSSTLPGPTLAELPHWYGERTSTRLRLRADVCDNAVERSTRHQTDGVYIDFSDASGGQCVVGLAQDVVERNKTPHGACPDGGLAVLDR
jgi:hypothetical protein